MLKEEFASDNYSGICPEAMQAIQDANQAHAMAYGDDDWTARAADKLRELFEHDCEVFFVFNGTAGNSLALATLCQPYHAIICQDTAHIETDECGAPEFFSGGSKLFHAKGPHGKLTPEAIDTIVTRRDDIHYPKPKAISLTQSTELGTVYTIAELKAIHRMAQKHSLKIHMDGARFANAVAALNCSPAEITWQSGVDILCFGGTKNGMSVGEAVIFFNRELAEDFDHRCKQAGQLASKMRFISAQWLGMLENDTWLRYAGHANEMAALLESQLKDIPGLELLFPRQANALFVNLPPQVIDTLHEHDWHFYTFIGENGARFMCSWDMDQINSQPLRNNLIPLTYKQ